MVLLELATPMLIYRLNLLPESKVSRHPKMADMVNSCLLDFNLGHTNQYDLSEFSTQPTVPADYMQNYLSGEVFTRKNPLLSLHSSPVLLKIDMVFLSYIGLKPAYRNPVRTLW